MEMLTKAQKFWREEKLLILLIICIVNLFGITILTLGFLDLKTRHEALLCDLGSAFFAEREYTYPILRQIDDPDYYGKGVKNPITTKPEYNLHCLNIKSKN
jgi:hypothetical protein